MKNIFIYAALIHSFIFGIDLRQIEILRNWKLLQVAPVKIEWKEYQGFPISRAETILQHDIKTIAHVIQDLDHYPDIFDRVTNTRRLESDVVQIVLDMPFPFDNRDYIVKYTIENSENHWVFSFTSVKHPNGPLDSNNVRLPNAAGIWILTVLESNKTKVVYAWNGELLGRFPDFGLSRAWVTQGTEVLNWLNKSLKKRNN